MKVTLKMELINYVSTKAIDADVNAIDALKAINYLSDSDNAELTCEVYQVIVDALDAIKEDITREYMINVQRKTAIDEYNKYTDEYRKKVKAIDKSRDNIEIHNKI